MPFNINDFIANINFSGVAKPANFEVLVHRPFDSDINLERDLQFRCTSVSTPGRHVNTAENKDFSMPKFIGYLATPSDLSMRVLLSEDLREKEYFEEWIDKIVGDYRLGSLNDQMFDLGFYDEYALNTVVEISQFGATGNIVHKHTLREAFPISVSSIENSWNDDSVLYLDVAWKYRFYTSQIVQQG